MFVRVMLAIPAAPGRTVIPRVARGTVDRHECVFIKESSPSGRFERMAILVAEEGNDRVLVVVPSNDLRPDEQVVTNGSLLLEQMYEDRLTTETGIVG